jgi:hypothetical protein
VERPPRKGRRLEPIVHGYSGFTLTAVPVVVRDEGSPYGMDAEERFVTPREARGLPLSVLDRKILQAVGPLADY